MLNNINISSKKQNFIVCIFLTVATFAVFWQVSQYDFINFDDPIYVTENSHVQSGITLEGLRWAFGTTYAEFWHPLTWLSLMSDYQLYGLNAGGYHVTNVILHLLSTLLLFWLFQRMTGAIWKSAFVAALFALHPLHVESVVWITKRKDVLSAFFWMLTLCLYVYYTEKPVIKRYLLVLSSFVLALMSKPMVVTLPVIMILLDYWPLNRFELKKDHPVLWQMKEKLPFFLLSAVFSIIAIYAQYKPSVRRFSFPLTSRLANASVSFMTYLTETFWPHNLAVFYPFPEQIPMWQVLGSALMILIISIAVIIAVKRLPYLIVGWLWYAITIMPVIGIIQINPRAMSDNYTYIPLTGLFIMIAWGVPDFLKGWTHRKEILLTLSACSILFLSIISWTQVGYWQNNITLYDHTLTVTDNNWLIYNNRGFAYNNLGNHKQAIKDYDRAIEIIPDYAMAYNNRGNAYNVLGNYRQSIEDYNKAIEINPSYADAYNNRGVAYISLGNYRQAIDDFGRVIEINPGYAGTYSNRGLIYIKQGNNELGCGDVQKACELGNCKTLEWTKSKGYCR